MVLGSLRAMWLVLLPLGLSACAWIPDSEQLAGTLKGHSVTGVWSAERS